MNETNDIEKRTLTIKRTLKAPRKLVWEAWTQPEHIAHWWGPHGMKTTIRKHNFTVGGEWEYSMTMPDGKDFISHGIYSNIKVPELIETSANFIPMTEGVTIVVSFIDAQENTEFVFKVIHPTEAYCRQQEEMGFMNGWGSVFDGMERYLSTLAA
ncbi:activator of HSP90 ATPase [Fulvivirga sp. M361]|uniref:SRPBCC domain-containing protein n=1 Tax=Fulvivirga sp. M361 TaxID=2594266 RepID=UPI00117AF865|nr:SRPBCC domain-containing protein [Fulvivirga sp. M361]TRX48700.1 activator of HSP90 ATPase [Fulvivirga sp. M361]